jgi:hypothetical protein
MPQLLLIIMSRQVLQILQNFSHLSNLQSPLHSAQEGAVMFPEQEAAPDCALECATILVHDPPQDCSVTAACQG